MSVAASRLPPMKLLPMRTSRPSPTQVSSSTVTSRTARLNSVGGMIPCKTEVIENTELSADLGPQWAQFGDISTTPACPCIPTPCSRRKAKNFNTVLDLLPARRPDDPDAVRADLAERYNAAYKELKESGDVDLSQYEYAYGHLQIIHFLFVEYISMKRRPQLRPFLCVWHAQKASPEREPWCRRVLIMPSP